MSLTPIEYALFSNFVDEATDGTGQLGAVTPVGINRSQVVTSSAINRPQAITSVPINAMNTTPASPSPSTLGSLALPPSPSGPASTSAFPAAPPGGRRTLIRLIVRKPESTINNPS